MLRGIEMEELLLTWSFQNGSMRHPTIQERRHKGALFPTDLIKTAHQAITRSAA